MKRTFAILMGLAALAASAAADDASKLPMSEGQWELTGETTMQGSFGSRQSGAVQPSKLCLTQKAPVPVNAKTASKGMTCSTQHTVTGSDVTWTTSCDGTASTTEEHGKATYAGKTLSGSLETTMKVKGSRTQMKVSTTLNGKYLGTCPK